MSERAEAQPRTAIHRKSGEGAVEEIRTVLTRRGHVIESIGNTATAIFPDPIPLDVWDAINGRGDGELQRILSGGNPIHAVRKHLRLYGRNSLRKLFRRLLATPERVEQRAALEQFGSRQLEEILEFYEALRVIAFEGDRVRLTRPILDLGPSLEQYVAWFCTADLAGHAEWGVSLEGTGVNDFDVIAWLPPTLVYFECKTGAPRNIDADALRPFLLRTSFLSPDLAILLVDTDDEIGEVCGRLPIFGPGRQLVPEAEFGGVHSGVFRHWPVYAINANPDIPRNIRHCLRHYHAEGKW